LVELRDWGPKKENKYNITLNSYYRFQIYNIIAITRVKHIWDELFCYNIILYCYENLLIVSRSSGSKVWMGLNGLRILHAEVLLAFSGKHFPDGPSIVASSIHGVHLERDRDPNAEGFLQLLLCRLPPQIRCSITLRDPRIPG